MHQRSYFSIDIMIFLIKEWNKNAFLLLLESSVEKACDFLRLFPADKKSARKNCDFV
jgi:hypothetical protein